MKLEEIDWWHRIKLPDGTYTPGKCFHGPDGGDWPTTRFGMPKDLTGKIVLDLGCYDGFFSFEAEKRNAKEVNAVDKFISSGFKFAHAQLNSKVMHEEIDLEWAGIMFEADIVLSYGVLYHLKNPLRHFIELAYYAKEMCLLETAISNQTNVPVLEYRPNFENDVTNYLYPNKAFIELASKEAGFKSCEEIFNMGSRATYRLLK